MTIHTLITGPTNGIGRATALELAKQQHKLFLLCRNESLGQALINEILELGAPEPVLLVADLANPDSIRSAVEQFEALELPLHILINNAGLMNTARATVEIYGSEQEQMFAVNHLGHFMLSYLLMPHLIQAAQKEGVASRFVIVSSEAHALFCKGIQFQDITYANHYKAFAAYGQSKLANLLMMKSWLSRLNPSEVQVNALHPGAVHSGLGENGSWYGPLIKALIRPFFLSPLQGAQTSLYLATGEITTQGEYYVKSKPHRMKPWALDEVEAERFWQYSMDTLKLSQP